MLVNMVDGFDLLAISFAGPAISREWLLGPERLGSALGAYLGGFLLAMRLERPELYAVLALPAIGAAIVLSLLAKRNSGAPNVVQPPLR